MKKNIVKLVEDVDVTLIEFQEDKRPATKGLIKYMFPKYENDMLVMQLPLIDIHQRFYGVPTKLDKYHKTDEDRNYIKLPLTEDHVEILEKFDLFLSTEEFKQLIFGNKANKYSYSPLIQKPEGKDAYLKVKIDVDYESRAINTKVLLKYNNKNQTREEVVINNINDMVGYVNSSQSICIVKATKLWIQSATHKYGLSLKVLRILVEDGTEFPQTSEYDLDFIIK